MKIEIAHRRLLADTITPVGAYLRLRDRFPGALMLESADSQAATNARSFICCSPIAEFRVEKGQLFLQKVGKKVVARPIEKAEVRPALSAFLAEFKVQNLESLPFPVAGAFGYMNFEAVEFFENICLENPLPAEKDIPVVRYAVFRHVIVFDHFRDEAVIAELCEAGKTADNSLAEIEQILQNRTVPSYAFRSRGPAVSNLADSEYIELVKKGIAHCARGDVFQIVLSRRFSRPFAGDEFNVYRALRSINPSPYLFFFDYGGYRLFGSSPESILVIEKNEAILHPIAGTFRRTGDEAADRRLALALKKDPKELAEHVMLVDLARNDLSKNSKNVRVARFQEVHYYSHLIHLVSEVRGKLPKKGADAARILADVFPAGTLSGAPKHMAMTLIDRYETEKRSFYGGCIGFFGFDGSVNQAIMIRTFLSKNNELTCQAGAGVVISSVPSSELAEVNTKLAALNRAVEMAETI